MVKRLERGNVRCTVLTARLQISAPGRGTEGSAAIVRIPVPQMWINRILIWRDGLRSIRASEKNPKEPHQDRSASTSVPSVIASAALRWGNSMAYIVGATIWLFLNRQRIDIIHVHIGDWIAGFAGWIGSHLRIPVVCKAADIPALPDLDNTIPFRRAWDRWRRRIHYAELHEAIGNELIEEGIPVEKIHRIPNGVEIPGGRANPSRGEHVLFVGNLSQGSDHKGFDILFNAWAGACSRLPNAKLVIAGHGDTAPWKKMTEKLGCASNILFAGHVHDLDHLYRKAALFVLPSRHEGMSNALLEAQAWGLPAVVSDIPGNRAVVKHGATGLIVPVGDHTALAGAILSLLNDPQTREEMGRRAARHIANHFAMDSVIRKYLLLYEKMAGQGVRR